MHYASLSKTKKIGTFQHSLNVALIGQMLLHWLRETEATKELFCISALLHDIGKFTLPDSILKKEDDLSLSEKKEFEKHVINGFQMLKNKNLDEKIKQAILTHHERIDGSGYPLKLKGDKISRLSRILAISDTYDFFGNCKNIESISNPFQIIGSFETCGYQKFDMGLMITFLRGIANNFLHYRVLLSDRQYATVVFINSGDLSRPLVKTDYSFIDLSIRRDIRIVQLDL